MRLLEGKISSLFLLFDDPILRWFSFRDSRDRYLDLILEMKSRDFT